MKVYMALHCPNIYESEYGVISLHHTPEGAFKAMENHKRERRKEWEKLYDNSEPEIDFGSFESWNIVETEILD